MSYTFRSRIRPSTKRQAHVCPVCSTVTSRQIAECKVCGWHGKFEAAHPQVAQAMDSLVDQCPNLQELLPYQWPAGNWFQRLWRRFTRRQKIDIRA
ncbi:MAG: hypothetical protein JNJ45_04465 [Chthonomonas sp.]|nr:hypothetical protein [Chthonomonas sp.]